MPSLLLIVFGLQLVIFLINTIGKSTLNELLWRFYNKFPTSTSKSVKETTRLKADIIRLKKEMNSFSAQDEFARWAKLDRQHGRAVAEYDKRSATLNSAKSKFDSTFSVIRWLSTNGMRIFLQFWYTRQPIFWIPVGSVPSYIEWILSFPKAPIGSVSIQVWGIACASVILLVSDAVAAVWALINASPQASAEPMKEKAQAFASQTPRANGEKGVENRKEL